MSEVKDYWAKRNGISRIHLAIDGQMEGRDYRWCDKTLISNGSHTCKLEAVTCPDCMEYVKDEAEQFAAEKKMHESGNTPVGF